MRFIVGITGASGQIFALRLLEILREYAEIHLVISDAAKITISHELDMELDELKKLAHYTYSERDLDAPFASGTFKHDGMVIIPCSMKTLSAIAYGFSDNLITRAADVTLKERRKLILAIRETPLNLNHLRAMVRACEVGAIIMPISPSFYIKPKKIEDLVDHFSKRVAELLGLDVDYKRWK
uniref:Flavin prenyltransferase UbiX n=1 Tax=Geoglobus ahangari TaxID=113653 RepID=A0A7C4W4D2_9EURY